MLVNETFSLALGLGFLLGLKHAMEADHLVAVTTMVSEQRSIRRSALVGALWGAGHTISLLAAGVVVILLRVVIPARIASLLELAVAVMIIFLGGRVLYALLRRQKEIHVHPHSHGGLTHSHLHFHGQEDAHRVTDSHPFGSASHYPGTGWRPLVVGMVHGLAGSAALTLLVLTEVVRGGSQALGLAYLLIFGVGSIGGMLLMSVFISLPFVFTSARFARVNQPVRLLAGIASVFFGMYYAWKSISAIY